MGSPREKGKIAQTEWPKILARYDGGETIASIARAYNCTAPAIRYIVKRGGMFKARARGGRANEGSRSAPRLGPGADATLSGTKGGRRSGRGMHVLGEDLRKRVSSDIASFLVALDQAVLDGSAAGISLLEEATDRLMRATARTRLELERLRSGYEAASKGGVREKAGMAQRTDA